MNEEAKRRSEIAKRAVAVRKGELSSVSHRTEKWCPKCRIVLPIEDFALNRASVDGYQAYCRSCSNKLQRVQGRARRKTLRDSLTIKSCAICRTQEPETTWHIDHDHHCCPAKPDRSCGRCIRGVLCRSCNIYLLPSIEMLTVAQQEVLLKYPNISEELVFSALKYLESARKLRRDYLEQT